MNLFQVFGALLSSFGEMVNANQQLQQKVGELSTRVEELEKKVGENPPAPAVN